MHVWDHVIVNADPVGTRLMGAPVQEAVKIDISAGMGWVVDQLGEPKRASVDELSRFHDCFPPISGKNLFVDFEAASARYAGKDTVLRIGIHLAAWKDCSCMFEAFNELPPIELVLYTELFGLVFYLQKPSGLHYLRLGVRVGLDQRGSLSLMDYFPLLPLEELPLRKGDKKLKKQLPWYVNLVFATFSGINAGRVQLTRLSKMEYSTVA